MKATRLAIPEVVLLEPPAYVDERGNFFESFNQQAFARATGVEIDFVQDNQSSSRRGVLRGLHYQLAPHAQGKLVRVVRGAAFDVAVDIREGSATYGQWVSATLTEVDRQQLWIPPGFAHGFQALEENTVFLYKTTAFYDRQSERAIRWDDPGIAITWPIKPPILSRKDAEESVFLR